MPLLSQARGEDQSTHQRRKPTELRPLPVGHGEAEGMPPRREDEGFGQRVHAPLAAREGFRSEILYRAADFLRRGRRGQRLSKRDSHRGRSLPRKFPKKSPAGKREDRAPHSMHITGTNG